MTPYAELENQKRKSYSAFKAARPLFGGPNTATMLSKLIGQKYIAIVKSW